MDQTPEWLIRTKDLFLSRPLTQKELIQKIERGDLNPLDEICPANGYWFGLHEAAEVRRFLGDVDLRKLSNRMEVEITSSTETEPLNKTKILEAKVDKTPLSVREPRLTSRRVRKPIPVLVFTVFFIAVLIFLWMQSD